MNGKSWLEAFEKLPFEVQRFQGALLDETRMHICDFAAKFDFEPDLQEHVIIQSLMRH